MNNNNNLENFIAELESIKMTTHEKNEMRNHLASFAVSYTPTLSPYHHITIFMRRTVALAFITIISIGSISNLASGQALPGDTLYPVKIAHEEIKLAATFGTKKKISYEIRRTEKRIQEATELASQQDLDNETQDEIANLITKQTTKVKEHINEVKEDNPEEALVLNSELKSTIKVNSEALRKVSTSITKQKKTEASSVDVVSETSSSSIIDENNIDQNGSAIIAASVTIPAKKIPTSESVDSEEEYEDVSVSFAENLLTRINEEVKNIEDFEDKVSDEITTPVVTNTTKEDDSKELLTPSVLIPKENTDGIDVDEEVARTEAIAQEIKSLGDILRIKKQINQLKISLGDDTTEKYNDDKVYKEVDKLINDRDYKKAFLLLKELYEQYQEQAITEEVEINFGIDLKNESSSDGTISPNKTTIKNAQEPKKL